MLIFSLQMIIPVQAKAAKTTTPAPKASTNAAAGIDKFEIGAKHGDDIYYGLVDKNGLPDIYGMYMWKDGRVYVGEYKNGLPHGNGVFRKLDGTAFLGSFSEGLEAKGTSYPKGGSYTELKTLDYPKKNMTTYTLGDYASQYCYGVVIESGITRTSVEGIPRVRVGHFYDKFWTRPADSGLYDADGSLLITGHSWFGTWSYSQNATGWTSMLFTTSLINEKIYKSGSYTRGALKFDDGGLYEGVWTTNTNKSSSSGAGSSSSPAIDWGYSGSTIGGSSNSSTSEAKKKQC
jgi:hypothetical protein